MRRGRTPSLALVLAALALASVTAAASDADDARIHLSRERRRGARDGGAHPATVGEGSAGLVDVPFDAKPIRGVRGGESLDRGARRPRAFPRRLGGDVHVPGFFR